MDLIPEARPLFRELTKIQGRREDCFCFQKQENNKKAIPAKNDFIFLFK